MTRPQQHPASLRVRAYVLGARPRLRPPLVRGGSTAPRRWRVAMSPGDEKRTVGNAPVRAALRPAEPGAGLSEEPRRTRAAGDAPPTVSHSRAGDRLAEVRKPPVQSQRGPWPGADAGARDRDPRPARPPRDSDRWATSLTAPSRASRGGPASWVRRASDRHTHSWTGALRTPGGSACSPPTGVRARDRARPGGRSHPSPSPSTRGRRTRKGAATGKQS